MIPKRISEFDINNKSLLSILHGNVDDVFVGGDTIKYNLEEILYFYLKQEGFNSVVFYNIVESFFSFSANDLDILFTDEQVLQSETNISNRRKLRKGPLGEVNSAIPSNTSDNFERNSQTYNEFNRFGRKAYRSNNSSIYSCVSYALNKKRHKIALIVNQAMLAGSNKQPLSGNSFFSDPKLTTFLIDCYSNRNNLPQNHVIIFNYGTQNTFKDGDLPTEIMNQIFETKKQDTESNERIIKNESDLYVGMPYSDEIRNLLIAQYFDSILPNLYLFKIDKIVQYFAMESSSIVAITRKNNLRNEIDKISTLSAWDKLSKLSGLENIQQQLIQHIEKIKKARLKGNYKVAPHIILKGPPGVGKTQVARLLAEILKEEGLISKGGFFEGSTGDLVGEYVGQSAPKTARLFRENRGNVLFIDEIYDLTPDGTENDAFKNEAVKQMLTEMDYPDWKSQSVFIGAGYKNKVDEFLRKTNQGFQRRIGIQLEIDHYTPETLFDILRKNIEEAGFMLTNEEVVRCLKLILQRLYATKDKTWGNAGEMEKIALEITNNADDNEVKIEDIPKNLTRLINIDISNSKSLELLNNMIGLSGVKNKISEIYWRLVYSQELAKRTGKASSEPLTFVFTGSPGTGKTTIARIIGNILFDLGLLKTSDYEEVTHDKMIYSSQVNEAFDKCLGKVLLIDEAYQIRSGEAINTIVQNLTSLDYDGKLAVIVAGYTNSINQWIQANDGLKSRFVNYIQFDDYSEEELFLILDEYLRKESLQLHNQCYKIAIDSFKRAKARDGNKFGNARYILKELIPLLKTNISKRLSYSGRKFSQIDESEFKLILPVDFPDYNEGVLESSNIKSLTKIKVKIKTTPYQEEMTPECMSEAIGMLLIDNGNSGEGSAFVVSKDGIIFTCEHCVPENKLISLRLNGETYTFNNKEDILYRNKNLDIAILKIRNVSNMFCLKINSSWNGLRMGAKVGLLSFPKGSELGLNVSYTEGIVSKKEGIYYHHTANATHGSSGGAFFDIETKTVHGILNGGFGQEGANINVATDIRELFKQNDIEIDFYEE